MACSIIRDKETGNVVQVLAPNGEPSLLYQNALRAFSQNQEKALRTWAKTYTSSYKLRYGDWEKGESIVPLDPNGEPTIETVIYTPADIVDTITTNYSTWEEFQPGEDGWVSYEKALKFRSILSKRMPGVKIDIMQNPSQPKKAKLVYGTSFKDLTVKFSKSEIKQQKQKVNDVMDYLVEKLPGLTYDWVSPSSLKQDEHYRDISGIRAFVRNNKIYLVEGRVMPEDGIEEIMHVFIEGLRQTRPSLFKGLLDNVRSNPKYEADYINIRDWHYSKYNKSQQLTDTINSEFLAKQLAVAMKAELEQNPEGRPTSALGKLIQRFLDWIGELFNAKSLKPGESLSVIASYINSKDIVLPLPEAEYLYYSADENANVDPDNRDDIDAMMKQNLGKTVKERNLIKANKEIEKLEKLKKFITQGKATRQITYQKQLEVVDILIQNVKDKIAILEEDVQTTSVTIYAGSADMENNETMSTKLGAGFGNFYHYLIEEIQDTYVDTGKSPSIIYSDPEWFDNFYNKNKSLILFKNVDKKVLREIGTRLVSKMDNLLSEGKILLPEISIAVEDIEGKILLGRLDVMTVDKNGAVDIVDLKTRKSPITVGDEFPQVIFTAAEKRVAGFKEGVDPVFDQFRNKSKLNSYQIQLSIYSEMLRKLGINVNNNIIYAVAYSTTSNQEETEFNLTGYGVGTFQTADFYGFYGKGTATNRMEDPAVIDQAARSRFREVGQILEEDSTQTESKQNAFASIDIAEQEKIIEKLDQLIQEQLDIISAEIKKIEDNENITIDEKTARTNSLKRRMEGILSVQQNIRKEKTGETEEDVKRSHAVVIKGAIDIFRSEIETLKNRVNKLDTFDTYEIGNEQHQKALKEIQTYTTNLDNIGKYIELFTSSIRSMNLDDAVKDSITKYFTGIEDDISNIRSKYIKVSKGVVKSIIVHTQSVKAFEKVFGDMRKVLGPKLNWIKKTIAGIEAGEIPLDTIGYKLKRLIQPIFNKHDNLDRLQALKQEAIRIEKLLEINTLNDKTLEDYLEGVIGDPEAPFYMGSTMSGTQFMLPMSDIIGSNVDSELIVNAMFQYMRNVTEEGRLDVLAWADDLNVDKFKNDFIESAGGISNANEMIVEEAEEHQVFDENGEPTQKETVRRYVAPFVMDYANTDAAYQAKLRAAKEKIKAINEAIRQTSVKEEKEKLREEKKELIRQQNELSTEYVKWQIAETNTRVKPEVMMMMQGSGEYNQEITDLYLLINNTILEAGGDENITPEDQEKIDYYEAEISRIRQDLMENQPELQEKLEKLLENFQFDLNYKLWIKKRGDIEKEGNEQQLKTWDLNNSDYVPTEEWSEKVAELNEEKRLLFGQDAILKDLYEQQAKIRARSKVRGKFNFKYLDENDINQYNNISDRIEKRLLELKDSSDLTDDERAVLININNKLNSIRTKKLRGDYTTQYNRLKKNVENAYSVLRDLEKKRDESGSVDRALLDQILDARNQYDRQEQVFADFFNKNNGTQYVMGTIAKRGSIKEQPNQYLYEFVPTSTDDMELVPNKKYKIRRLKEEAYNPEYQESFEKRINGRTMLPMPKGIRFNTVTKEFEITDPSAKYINPKFLQLQKNKKGIEFYNKWIIENFLVKQKQAVGQPLGFNLPFVKQLALENVINKGIAGLGREYKEKAQDMMYNTSKFEKATNESGMAGADRILFKENQKMPAALTTTNGIEAIMNWNSGFYLNRKMATVGLEMSVVLDYLKDRVNILGKSAKTNPQHAELVVKINTIINQIEYNKNKFVHGQIYERETAPNKIFNRKTARIFMQAAAFGRMAFDVPMQIGNLLSGNVQAFLSTSSSRHADESDYLAAKKMLYMRWFPKLLADYGKVSETSIESKIYRYMNPLSKDLDKMFDVNTASKLRRAANRVFSFGDMSMAIQDKGELEIGLTTMLMIMHHQKYEVFETDASGNIQYENGVPVIKKDADGNTVFVNAIDAFEMDNNNLVIRKDVNVTSNELARLKGLIMTEIYRFQGNYAGYTRSRFGSTLIGSLYEFYRKYLIPAVSVRFSFGGFEGTGSAYSWDTEEAYMGWYTAMGKMFKYYGLGTATKTLLYDTLLPGFAKKAIKYESEVEDYYRARSAMAGREIMFAIAAYMLYQALRQLVMDSDDDDLSTAELMAIRALVKTANESKSMVPVPWIGGTRDYIDQFSQLTSVLREGKTAWDLVENAGWYADYSITGSDFAYQRGFYQRDTDRYEEGDAKVMKNFNDMLGISNIVDVYEPYEAAKRAVRNK